MAWSLIAEIEQHEGLITPEQAITLTRLSRSTVYRMMDRQEIPNMKMGSRRVIDPHTWAYVLKRREPMLREATRNVRARQLQ